MDDEALRNLVRSQTGHVPATRSDCPSPELLQAVATSPRGDAPQRVVLEHVATCAACRRDFDLFRVTEAASVPTRTAMPRWVPMLAAASVIAVVSLLATRSRDDVVRGDGRDERRASTAVQLIAPVRVGAGMQLQWHAVHQAVMYRVEVTDGEGNLSFGAETADTVVLAPLLTSASLRWSVEARQLDGTLVTSTLDSLHAPLNPP